MSALLEVDGLVAGYGGAPVVRGLDLRIEQGEVVALLGSNGAGKSTTMLALGGVLPAAAGRVRYRGAELRGPLHRRAKRGVGLIVEGRSVFGRLSVADNLALAGGDRDHALAVFPELAPLLDRQAGLLSGGEQQILVLARMLATRPELLLVDELSLGLAPLVVSRLLDELRAAADRGIGVLLVEQHARRALPVCDRAYIMRRGAIELEGTGWELLARFDEIERSYLHAPVESVGAGHE